ncbi:uncharacterized protein LOC126058027 isoform X1 [Elephas maximus indicus]|uniref:uncharacterized protein LOC126058027 isoform X1 n=1 Tax=Elephas maximus indicus TaxID=99487 RepID=UPI002115E910|nr:uncharacterized protein LOC126058027 isoform X1 [Elephas maximus indicus]
MLLLSGAVGSAPTPNDPPVDDRGDAALSSTVLTVVARPWTTEGMLLCPPPSSRSWPVRGRQRGCCSVLHHPHGRGLSVDDRGGAALSSTVLTVVARGRQRGCCSVLHRPHGRGPSVDDRGGAALSSTVLTVMARPWTTEGVLLCPPPPSRSWPVRGRQRGCCSVLHRPHGRGPPVDYRGGAALSSTVLTVVARPWTTEGCCSVLHHPHGRGPPVDDRGGAALSSTVLTVVARPWMTEGMLLCPPPSSQSWPVDNRGGAALSSTVLTVVARPWTTEGMLLCPPPSSRSWPARGRQRGAALSSTVLTVVAVLGPVVVTAVSVHLLRASICRYVVIQLLLLHGSYNDIFNLLN